MHCCPQPVTPIFQSLLLPLESANMQFANDDNAIVSDHSRHDAVEELTGSACSNKTWKFGYRTQFVRCARPCEREVKKNFGMKGVRTDNHQSVYMSTPRA